MGDWRGTSYHRWKVLGPNKAWLNPKYLRKSRRSRLSPIRKIFTDNTFASLGVGGTRGAGFFNPSCGKSIPQIPPPVYAPGGSVRVDGWPRILLQWHFLSSIFRSIVVMHLCQSKRVNPLAYGRRCCVCLPTDISVLAVDIMYH